MSRCPQIIYCLQIHKSTWFLPCKYRMKKHKKWFEIYSSVWSKNLTVNQILKFSNQLYLKSNRVNQHDFLHVEIVWRKIKADLKSFNLVRFLSTNQVLRFLNQLYLKSNRVNQHDFFLCWDILKKDRGWSENIKFGEVRKSVHQSDAEFLNQLYLK